MNSICRFIPQKPSGDLKTVHFVYETEFKKMKQPFIYPIYYMHLVTKGSGKMKLLGREYIIEVGSLFFAFPGVPYEIEGSDDLAYMYISFMGERAKAIVDEIGLGVSKPTVDGFAGEIGFWKSAIQRVNSNNANMLSESVLLYTLSFIDTESGEARQSGNTVVENIIAYIEHNFADPDLSLKKIADIFAYTDKYLSHIFKQQTDQNFNEYLTELRVRRSVELMNSGERGMERIANACGYRDPVYFAKVFKRVMGKTPHEYLKSKR